MLQNSLGRKTISLLGLSFVLGGLSHVALSQESTNAPSTLISDGQTPVKINGTEATVVPPKGWEYVANTRGLTLVMQEPKQEEVEAKKDYSKPKFQRNITLALIQRPSMIDSARTEEFVKELQASYAKDSLVKNFQVIEAKRIDLYGKEDALVVFSSFQLNEFQMMQMHLLASDAHKQFLLSYTDLASEFTANKVAYDSAWKSLVSIGLTSKPEPRYMQYIPYGVAAMSVLVLFGIVRIIRNRQIKRQYHEEGDAIYNDETDLGVSGAKRAFSGSFDDSFDWNLSSTSSQAPISVNAKRANTKVSSMDAFLASDH